MKWRPYGPGAILVEFAEKPGDWAFHKCLGLVHVLNTRPHPAVVEYVPGYTNLLLDLDCEADALPGLADEIVSYLQTHAPRRMPPGSFHELPVHYDGPDLERVADRNRITPAQVIKYHSSVIYTVFLLGFSPGFPYLGHLHHKLITPRLPEPRPRVPAGSVAIGGDQTGIYSVESPGGWNIIGHTPVCVFDLNRASAGAPESAFLLTPGDRIRFIPV